MTSKDEIEDRIRERLVKAKKLRVKQDSIDLELNDIQNQNQRDRNKLKKLKKG